MQTQYAFINSFSIAVRQLLLISMLVLQLETELQATVGDAMKRIKRFATFGNGMDFDAIQPGTNSGSSS